MIDRVFYLLQFEEFKPTLRYTVFQELMNNTSLYGRGQDKISTHDPSPPVYFTNRYLFDENFEWYIEIRPETRTVVISNKMYYIFNHLLKMDEKECRMFLSDNINYHFMFTDKHRLMVMKDIEGWNHLNLPNYWKTMFEHIELGNITKL